VTPGPRRCAAATGRVLGKMRRACRRWDLLPDGEGVAVGLSGGGDSLALVHLLATDARSRGIPRRIVAVHVAADGEGERRLIADDVVAWCRRLGVEVVVVPPRLGPEDSFPLDCFRCSRVRRRTLLETADGLGLRWLALGHHADDVVETFLVGLLYTGRPDVLRPARSYFGGAVTLVRPMWEVPGRDVRRLVRLCRLPVVAHRCPVERDARRNRVREMLAGLGRDARVVRRAVFGAARRCLEGEHLC